MPLMPKQPDTGLPGVRKGQGSTQLTREEFERRWRERFYDPAFDAVAGRARSRSSTSRGAHTTSIGRTLARARPVPSSPIPTSICRSNGSRPGERIREAERGSDGADSPSRVLLVCGVAAHDETCPGEMSKTFRLTASRETF